MAGIEQKQKSGSFITGTKIKTKPTRHVTEEADSVKPGFWECNEAKADGGTNPESEAIREPCKKVISDR